VKPLHVAAYIEELQGELSAPSVKQHLAGLLWFRASGDCFAFSGPLTISA